jgi:tetratricopeptide (TPR) repeat protein
MALMVKNMKASYDVTAFGVELRKARLALGWTAKQLALLYSEAIGREDDPVDVSFIYRLEVGKDMLADKGRRALLAKLVDMPLAVAGVELAMHNVTINSLTWKHIDTREYTSTLQRYCATWQQGTTYKAVSDIKKRVSVLERAAFYSPSVEKQQLVELLCGYHILAADVAAEQLPGAADPILTSAIEIAKQENLYNIYAHALRQRAGAGVDTFEQTRNYSILNQALADFQVAETIQQRISPFYQGLVDIRRGLVYAYLAQDQSDFTRALSIIDASSKQIGKQSTDQRVAARLDEERYRLNRASAYLYSLQGSPQLALVELNQAMDLKPNTSPRRGVHRDLLFAETYIALGNYPMAVACAVEAVETSSLNGMDTLYNRLENVYRTLRNSPYGKDPEVARLGVQILKARHPELFE